MKKIICRFWQQQPLYGSWLHAYLAEMEKGIFLLIFVCFFNFTGIYAQEKSPDEGSGRIRIASCQFPVSADIGQNLAWIRTQMIESALKKADVVHFPECGLSGYPGSDMTHLEQFDWEQLHQSTDSILTLARELKLWVLLGSIHPLTGNKKPFNSLYVINPEGKIIDRYDKRFCTSGDLNYFSPGDHFVTFNVHDVKCGLLICYDIRFPELYREYRKLGVDLIFQSFYNARQQPGSIHPVIMPVTAQSRAATNYFYMSLTNSSAAESWPCHFITPDGLIQNKLPLNQPGILISEVNIHREYYDASAPYRENAMEGKLNSGETLPDELSENRTGY